MSTRLKIPTKVELDVIDLSTRRCCMCFSLDNDISKTGDIGKANLNTLLELAAEALLRMSEEKRVKAFIAIKDFALRKELIVLFQAGLRMIQKLKG